MNAPLVPESISTKKWGWENSWAKEILRQGIIAGDIPALATYDQIHGFHAEVLKTDRSKIPARVRALRKQIADDDGAANSDAQDLERDRKLFPIKLHDYKGEPRWQGSSAEKQLKKDVANQIHLTMNPTEFYQSNSLYYNSYCQETIRKHIYQEIKFQKYCLWRNDKKKTSFTVIK